MYKIKFRGAGAWKEVIKGFDSYYDAELFELGIKAVIPNAEVKIEEIEPERILTREEYLENEADSYHKEK